VSLVPGPSYDKDFLVKALQDKILKENSARI